MSVWSREENENRKENVSFIIHIYEDINENNVYDEDEITKLKDKLDLLKYNENKMHEKIILKVKIKNENNK